MRGRRLPRLRLHPVTGAEGVLVHWAVLRGLLGAVPPVVDCGTRDFQDLLGKGLLVVQGQGKASRYALAIAAWNRQGVV